ncbi:MAG: ribonuclease D [Synechococcaceae cyanobacterium SM2_3_2]|nr:ribonuclease D [Synechococcaceae cyanobacterium SM2_3_2]
MKYLTDPLAINAVIPELASHSIVWMDTEVADYKTRHPRLSLVQILTETQESYILDVLDQPKLIDDLIQGVMVNPAIQKVFHNAAYDLRFLGKSAAQSVTCTLKLARLIPYHLLPVSSHSLKSLVLHFFQHDLSKAEQSSDWGYRPLTASQLDYARDDIHYLSQVHAALKLLYQKAHYDPAVDSILEIETEILAIQEEWKQLDSRYQYLKERAKAVMLAQDIKETDIFSLKHRTTEKVPFVELAQLGIPIDFEITLNATIRKSLTPDQLNQLTRTLSVSDVLSFRKANSDDAEVD